VKAEPPWCPPIVALAAGGVGHLIAWEQHERDGSWYAWVSWVQESGGQPVHKLVAVQGDGVQPLEPPEAYSGVPRRIRGNDGVIRPLISQAERQSSRAEPAGEQQPPQPGPADAAQRRPRGKAGK
jgi:hypothetical protein